MRDMKKPGIYQKVGREGQREDSILQSDRWDRVCQQFPPFSSVDSKRRKSQFS
jgi:hypothetical protein